MRVLRYLGALIPNMIPPTRDIQRQVSVAACSNQERVDQLANPFLTAVQLHPAQTGRCGQKPQPKPLDAPQDLGDGPDPCDPVSTLMAEKPLAALLEPHSGHSGFNPSEYAEIEALTSKRFPQS
jgi:hypothetical protein